MIPERWRQVERVYHAALAAPPEARAALLSEACQGDAALRTEVESLLDHAASSGVLDGSVAGIAANLASSAGSALAGRRLGGFEVHELLGAGGMGEVYRARDTRLGRDVAIKTLPPAFKRDPDRVARFEREARVLASLNHPHIAVIHGVEEVDDVTALVMELVEGDDLSQRPAMRIDEALAVARQVAEALEAAHEQGIIHRDLKPANIKVRPDGTVKVLDFGLATVVSSAPGTPAAAGRTEPGVILGTAGYMSPEQARGEAVSRHTDIWAFGVLLYELLTGVSPFARASTPETIAAVLSDSPNYARLPDATPPRVRRLIRRCLEKDRKRRLQHIGDARFELEEPSSSDGVDAPPATTSRTAERMRKALAAVAVILAVAALSAGVAAWLARQPVDSAVVRTIIAVEPFFSGTDRSIAFTPDGGHLAYITRDGRNLLVRPLDALEPAPILTTPAYMRGVFPSPDGRWFGYVENSYTLKKVATSGGAPLRVVTMDGPSRGAAWGGDDTIVFATGAPDTGLQRVAAGGGPVTVLTRPDRGRGEADHTQPAWLPGGRSLLYTIVSIQGGLDASKVAVLDLATGTSHVVLEGAYSAHYVDSGHLVYAAAGALWATRFDRQRLEVRGTPREVSRRMAIGVLGAVAEFDISSKGALAYTHGVFLDRRVPVWVDRRGREEPLPVPPSNYLQPRLSPDGRQLAITIQGDIYLWDFSRPWSSASRVTSHPGIDWYPVWTPDARRIVFGSWRGGRFSNVYVHDLRHRFDRAVDRQPRHAIPHVDHPRREDRHLP